MNNNKEFDLLSDLAKLIKKYGPETFEALGEQITNPKFTTHYKEKAVTILPWKKKRPV